MKLSKGDENLIIGVDIGTTNIKAGIVNNKQYFCVKYKYKTIYNSELKTAEQDPLDYLKGVLYCIGTLIKELDIKSKEVEAIVFSGHSPSIICVDRDGNALGNSIIWQDKRASAEAEILEELLEVYINASFNEAKMLWVYRNNKYIYDRTFKFLQPKDYVIMKLTGEFVIDKPSASTMPAYDQAKNSFEKLAKVNLDEKKVPSIIDSYDIVGTLKREYSESLGLSTNVNIVCGSIDAFCEALGCGIYDNIFIGESTGTSTCVFTCAMQCGNKPFHVLPDKFLNVLPMAYTGGCIEWFIKNILGKEMSENTFKQLEYTLLETQPGSNGLIFLPYICGGRSPIWNDNATGCFIGLTKAHSYKDMWRSMLEGIAFNLKQNITILDKFNIIKKIYATGGGNQNNQWLQIKANICGRSFCKLKFSDGAIIGDIILGELSLTKYNIQDIIKKYIIIEEEYFPETEYAERYNQLYGLYIQLYDHLKNDFANFAVFRKGLL